MFTIEDFIKTLQSHGIELSAHQCSQFATYAAMLVDWNQRMNLTAIVEPPAIYEKHFLDCILPTFDVEIQGHLCDIGAGAGFPSIPMKIVYPDLAVTIVEPLGKRITFLKALCEALQLQGVTLVNERAEEYVKSHRESFDVVSARAVANLVMLSELCIPYVKEQGVFLAMKGASALEEVEAAKQAFTTLGCRYEQAFAYTLSDGSKRYNITFRKVKASPSKYPRPFAQIKKYPL